MALINGTNGDDLLTGTAAADDISGRDGMDTIFGLEGDDTLDGGKGGDSIEGGDGHDEIDGGSGNDTIDGGDGNDTIDGGSGVDNITGGAGDDSIFGFSGNDVIDGGDGNDTIDGGSGDNQIAGGAGNDLIDGASGWDTIQGGEGDDTIIGGSGQDVAAYDGNVGNFTISTSGADLIVDDQNAADGDEGTDTLNEEIFYIQFGDYTLDLTSQAQNAPVALVSTQTTDEDNATSFGLTVVDFDGDAVQTPVISVTSTNAMGATVPSSIAIVAGPTPGTAGLGSATDFTVQYDPGDGYQYLAVGESVTETVTVTSTDEFGASFTQTFDIVITGVNDAPEANDVAAAANEDGPAVAISSDYTDVDASDTHTVTIDTTGTIGSVTDNGDGTFSYDPNGQFETLSAGQTATDTFTYTVDDGNGGTDTATVTVTITGQNDAPDAFDVFASVSEDGPGTTIIPSFFDIDALDSHTFTFDDTGTTGTVTDNFDGTFFYDPDGQFESLGVGEMAIDIFTYTVDDGNGGTDTATVEVTVTGENDAPVAGAVSDSFNEVNGANILIDLRDYVSDPDVNDTLSFSNVTLARGVTVIPYTIVGNGLISINPDALLAGGLLSPDSIFLGTGESIVTAFSFTVTDDSGATNNSSTGELTVTINGLNEPVVGGNSAPTAHAVSVTGLDEEDGVVGIPFSDLATDPDIGDTLTITSMTWVDGNGITRNVVFSGGVNTGEAGDVVIDLTQFGLEEGDLETIEITFTVEDAEGLSSTNTLSLEIAGDTPGAGNNPPIAGSIPGPGGEIQEIIVDDPGTTTLEIDLGALVSDPDGDPLTITVDAFVIGFDEVTGAPITIPVAFNPATGIATVTFADLGLADGESLIGTLQYSVSDGTDTSSGQVSYNYVDPDDGGATAEVLDFEPFTSDVSATIEISSYEGFTFTGSAIVYETGFDQNGDPELGDGSGRDGDIYAGIINGQTTVPGDNVLVGTYTEISVPVLDGTGAPVLDERGNPVYETVLDENFGFTAPGMSFGPDDPGLFFGSTLPGQDFELPAVLPAGIGTAFNLDGLSLNVVGADNVTVTITLYTIDIVEVGPSAGFPSNSDYYYQLVEVDSFQFVVNASDGAEVLDFNSATFADDVPGADDITSFDGVYAVTITTDDGTAVVVDDILITI